MLFRNSSKRRWRICRSSFTACTCALLAVAGCRRAQSGGPEGHVANVLEVYALDRIKSPTYVLPVPIADEILYRDTESPLGLADLEAECAEVVTFYDKWTVRIPVRADAQSRFREWGRKRVGKWCGVFVLGQLMCYDKIPDEWMGRVICIGSFNSRPEAEQLKAYLQEQASSGDG